MILIVITKFDKSGYDVLKSLRQGAEQVLGAAGMDFKVLEVPGAIELATAAQYGIQKYAPEAVIALGCVIKGATDHYEYVLDVTQHALTRVALDERVPVIHGVLACRTSEHARERKHMGTEYAQTALDMINLLKG